MWTEPQTFLPGDSLTPTIMDTQLTDNLAFLDRKPRSFKYLRYLDVVGGIITGSSTSLQPLYGDSFDVELTTGGGGIQVIFHGLIKTSVIGAVLRFNVDVSDLGYIEPDIYIQGDGGWKTRNLIWTFDDLEVGRHTFSLAWAIDTGQGQLHMEDNMAFIGAYEL